MKKNTILLVVSIVIMVMILTFALSSWNKESEEEIVLRFGTWSSSPAENVVFDRVIDVFTRKTGIYVERETYPYNYSSIMTSKLRENEEPDVFFVSQMDYRFWQHNGWLKNVNDLVANPGDYYRPIRETFRTRGEFYTVPKDFASIMLYINEDLLNEAGFKLEDVPQELAAMPSFLEALQAHLPEGITAMTVDVQFENFMSLFEKLDPVAYSTFDFAESEPIQDFIQQFSQLVQSGALKLMNENLEQERAGEQFRKQETVLTLEGNWLYNDLNYYESPFHYHVEQLPQINGETPMAAYFTGYGISADTEYAEAAGLFVKYLTSAFAPYVVDNISSFPASASVAAEVFGSESNLDDIGSAMVEGLGKEVVVGRNYYHVIYSYYFGMHLPEIIANPENSAAIFEQILAEADGADKYVREIIEIRNE